MDPLAPSWREWSLPPQRAGARTTARLVLENTGSATWRSRGEDGLRLERTSYYDFACDPVWRAVRVAA